MRFEEVLVTPEVARRWLERNAGNRRVRESHVEALALAMMGGEWRLTHQGIAFDPEGNLLDGQHRLRAVVLAETPVRMTVARDVAPEAFAALDLGKARRIADVLRSDPYDTEMATFVARLANKGQHPTPPMVEATLRGFAAELAAFRESVPRTKVRKLTAVAVRSAVLVRSAAPGTRAYVLGAYAAVLALRLEEVPPVVQAFTRQLLGKDMNAKGGATAKTAEVFVRAFQAFDPKRAGVPRLQVKDPEGQLADALRIVRAKVPA
jgi:hypothetical protein